MDELMSISSQELDLNQRSSQKDLEWSLSGFSRKERGYEFIQALSSYISIYSPLVSQLYGAYDVVFSGERAVILPKEYSFSETHSNIPKVAISPTSYYLIPTKKGLRFLLKVNGEYKPFTLRQGFKAIEKKIRRPFLPVIQKGDLREFRMQFPILRLHTLNEENLNELSRFQIKDIRRGITSKAAELMSVEPKLLNWGCRDIF